MIYTDNLADLIFDAHKKYPCDSVKFLGGWLGPSPVQKFSRNSIDTKIVYGCWQKANKRHHQSYVNITQNSRTDVLYADSYNHSKIYVWEKNNNPVYVLAGSANFSNSAIYSSQEEFLNEVQRNDYINVQAYVDSVISQSTLCTNYNPSKPIVAPALPKGTQPVLVPGAQVGFQPSSPMLTYNYPLDRIVSLNPLILRVALLKSPGVIHPASGLNWGHGQSHTTKSDAYIVIRVGAIGLAPSLFPNQGIATPQPRGSIRPKAEAVFDDGFVMDISFEGTVKRRGQPSLIKQLTSRPRKDVMGKYFRKRLGLGHTDKVEYSDLKRYGRDSVDIMKISQGVYSIDFSAPKIEERITD